MVAVHLNARAASKTRVVVSVAVFTADWVEKKYANAIVCCLFAQITFNHIFALLRTAVLGIDKDQGSAEENTKAQEAVHLFE